MAFLSNLSQSAKKSLQRFPLVSIIAIFGSLLLISILSVSNDLSNFQPLLMVLTLSVSWLVGCQFLSESLKHNNLNRFVFKVVILLGLTLFYFYLSSLNQDLPQQAYDRWLLLLLAGHLFVVFSPFTFMWDKGLFWNYLKSMLLATIRSGIYAIVLYIGLALAIAAFDFLLNLDLGDNIYFQTFIFCLGIVNTFVYLHDFPKVEQLDKRINFTKPTEVLIVYILIPLSLLYILIVYTYAIKILIDWELPNGWVTYLISGLSLLAFLIHIGIEPVRHKHDSVLITKFFPYYFFAIIPLLPLLFIALIKRISDYNFTELRYLGVVLAIWITGILFYMLFSGKKRLSFYPKSIFILVLLCTFGPLSAFKISLQAQIDEFAEIMENLEAKDKQTFSLEEYDRFSSIVKYLDYRDRLQKTEAFLGFNPKELFSETSSYSMPKKIVNQLNIQVLDKVFKNSGSRFYYKLKNFEVDFAEEITTYTNFTILNLDKEIDETKGLQLFYDEKNVISFMNYGETLMEYDMNSHLNAMANKYDNINKASQDEFTFRFKNENGDFLIIFENLSFSNANKQVDINRGKAMLFYKTFSSLELP